MDETNKLLRQAIGDLFINNISLQAQVLALSAEIVKLKPPEDTKPKE